MGEKEGDEAYVGIRLYEIESSGFTNIILRTFKPASERLSRIFQHIPITHDFQASQKWHEEENDATPFIKYLLGIILSCYRDFEERVDMMGKKSTAYDIVKKAVGDTLGKFTKKEILERCPSLKSSSVENVLKKLREEGFVEKYGSGRNTFYAKSPKEN